MENAQFARTVNPCRFNQADVKRRLCVLTDEEYGERCRNRWNDQWDERIENSKRLRDFVESDESELCRYHHHDEHEDEHRILPFEVVERESVCSECREVSREDSHRYRDNQAVFEAGPDVDVLAEGSVVIEQRITRDQGETRYDFSVRPSRVDDHHQERDEAYDRKNSQTCINQASNNTMFRLFFFRWRHFEWTVIFTFWLRFAIRKHTPCFCILFHRLRPLLLCCAFVAEHSFEDDRREDERDQE